MLHNVRWNKTKSFMGVFYHSIREERHFYLGDTPGKNFDAHGVDIQQGMWEDAEMAYFFGMNQPANMLVRFNTTPDGMVFCEVGTISEEVFKLDYKEWGNKNCRYKKKMYKHDDSTTKKHNLKVNLDKKHAFCRMDQMIRQKLPGVQVPKWMVANGDYNRPSKPVDCLFDFHNIATETNEYNLFSYCAKAYFFNGKSLDEYLEAKKAADYFRKDWLLYLAEGRLSCTISGNHEEDRALLAKGYQVELVHTYNFYHYRFFAEMVDCPELRSTLVSYEDNSRDGKFFFAGVVGGAQLKGKFKRSYWGNRDEYRNKWVVKPKPFWNEETYRRFIICILRDADKFDEETTKELDIEYYKFGPFVAPPEGASEFDVISAVDKQIYEGHQFWINMIKDTEFMEGLHREKFHVGFAEYMTPHSYAYVVYHALNLPVMVNIKSYSPDASQMVALGVDEELGGKCIPAVNDTKFGDHKLPKDGPRCEKIKRTYRHFLKRKIEKRKKADEYFGKLETSHFIGFHGQNVSMEKVKYPGLRELAEKVHFFFVNGQPELEFDGGEILAKVGKLKWVGGVHMQKKRDDGKPVQLDQKIMEKHANLMGTGLEKIMRKFTNLAARGLKTVFGKCADFIPEHPNPGIVLISFGSAHGAWQQLDQHRFELILSVIKRFPHLLFVWKLTPGDERIEELAKVLNIYAAEWVDQQAILASPHIRAFISHCGRNSQLEAAFNGVPLICVPMHFDQFYNAESSARNGLGIVLDIKCLHPTEENPNSVTEEYCFTQEILENAIELTTQQKLPKVAELKTLLNNRKSAGEIILEALDEILATYNFHGNEEKIDSGTENKSAETVQDIQASDREPHHFHIGVIVNRSHGGDVRILKDFDFKDAHGKTIKAKAMETFVIEDLLLAIYGVHCKYISPSESDWKNSEMGKPGTIVFLVPHEFSADFKVAENEEVDAFEFAKKLSKIDHRWLEPGELEGKGHHIFEPLFNGHVMVPLSLRVGNGQFVEITRFHFNMNGLNIFRKERKVNFFYDAHGNARKDDGTKRGTVRRHNRTSKEHLGILSAPMSIEQMKQIAVKIVNGRKWQIKHFNCMHFAFEFIFRIVDAENAEKLKQNSSWPSELAKLEQYSEKVDKIYALRQAVEQIEHKPKL